MKRFLLFLLFFLILGYLATGIYQVSPGELAVVRRFGQALPAPEGPGLHFGLPWGCDRVDKVAVDEPLIEINQSGRSLDKPAPSVRQVCALLIGEFALVEEGAAQTKSVNSLGKSVGALV